MSEIITDKLTGKTAAGNVTITSEGGAATMQLQQGVAKAWVNFNGTGTIAFRDSFNHSSLTDLTTGTYECNLTSSLINDDYSLVVGVGRSTTSFYFTMSCLPSHFETAQYSLSCVTQGGTNIDFEQPTSALFGDLA